ncbi:hypothetical protein V1477_011539 [Vespula maculifrons]|uniref:Uncharacterized protein n=1 Tax=Vespula maculifrons TaxID=7453 RepID=A0ABD2BZK6_VESMC
MTRRSLWLIYAHELLPFCSSLIISHPTDDGGGSGGGGGVGVGYGRSSNDGIASNGDCGGWLLCHCWNPHSKMEMDAFEIQGEASRYRFSRGNRRGESLSSNLLDGKEEEEGKTKEKKEKEDDGELEDLVQLTVHLEKK